MYSYTYVTCACVWLTHLCVVVVCSVTAVGATQGPEAGTAEIAESSSTGGLITTGINRRVSHDTH